MELFFDNGRLTDLTCILILVAAFIFTVWGVTHVRRADNVVRRNNQRIRDEIDLRNANEAGY